MGTRVTVRGASHAVGNDASISSKTPRTSQYLAKKLGGRWATDEVDEPGLLNTASSFSIDERHSTLLCGDCVEEELATACCGVNSFETFATQDSLQVARTVYDAENFDSLGKRKIKNDDSFKSLHAKDPERPQFRMLQARSPSHFRLCSEKIESLVRSDQKAMA